MVSSDECWLGGWKCWLEFAPLSVTRSDGAPLPLLPLPPLPLAAAVSAMAVRVVRVSLPPPPPTCISDKSDNRHPPLDKVQQQRDPLVNRPTRQSASTRPKPHAASPRAARARPQPTKGGKASAKAGKASGKASATAGKASGRGAAQASPRGERGAASDADAAGLEVDDLTGLDEEGLERVLLEKLARCKEEMREDEARRAPGADGPL